MQQGKLTHAWTKASAAQPLKQRLMGVVVGPREVDPVIRSESWVALGSRAEGRARGGQGGFPEQALLRRSR